MGNAIMKLVFKNGDDALLLEKYKSVNEIPLTLIDGSPVDKVQNLVKDKKLYLIVNVASK
jgi:hypothetical protein